MLRPSFEIICSVCRVYAINEYTCTLHTEHLMSEESSTINGIMQQVGTEFCECNIVAQKIYNVQDECLIH